MSRIRHSFAALAVAILFVFTGLLTVASLHGCGKKADDVQRTSDTAATAVVAAPTARSPAQEKQRIEYEQAALENPEWTGPLSSRLNVRTEADSWDELVAKVKPTFTWGKRTFRMDEDEPEDMPDDTGFPDMMWIDQGSDGEPVFSLARAFAWAPTYGEKARWVLLDVPAYTPKDDGDADEDEYGPGALRRQIAGREMPIRVRVTSEIPGKPDGGGYAAYAISLGTDPRGGTVYEIGWPQEMNEGSWQFVECRRLYVWRDQAGTWRRLGKGPSDSYARIGYGACGSSKSQSSVQWRDTRPVVTVVLRSEQHQHGGEDGGIDTTVKPIHVTCSVATLNATVDELPAKLEWSKTEYLMTAEGDTLATIVHRLAVWDEYHDELTPHWWEAREENPSPELLTQRAETLKAVVAHLRRLNPNLPANENEKLPADTRIVIRVD